MKRQAMLGVGLCCAASAGLLLALSLTGAAAAHRSGCHSQHTCPSDHHTYVWNDAGGRGWDCAAPTASEYDPGADTTTIVSAGLSYRCRAVGAAAGATTTATGTTTPATGWGSVDVGRTVLLAPRTRTARCVLGPNPDRRCSPSAYYTRLTKAVLCSSTFRTGSVRHVTESVQRQVEIEYGIAPKRYGRALEIDHIVSLELGGSNDMANLFAERADAHPGYAVKDKLENRLHGMVCDGSISLRAAQRGIAANWQILYKRVYGVTPS